MTDVLMRLIRESFEYSMTDVHTCFPGVIERYVPKTRRADIQPSLKRRMPDGSFTAFPIVPDIPVRFMGTKKYTIHIPLEKGDEVAVHVIERSTDVWRDKGGDGNEDTDPRRFSLMDCYAVPGLQPQEFIGVEEEGLVIKHHTDWDGEFISHVIMDDDKIEAKYKEKCNVLLKDDFIECKTECNTTLMTKEQIKYTNGKVTHNTDGDNVTWDIPGNLVTNVGGNITTNADGNITEIAGGVHRSNGATVEHK